MKYLIDSNIFLRVLVREDKKSYIHCVNLLERVKKGRIHAITTSLNISEIVWTLLSYYKLSKLETVRAVKAILNLKGLKIIDRYDINAAFGIYENNNVKYIDAMIASIKEINQKKWIVVSYDKDFDKLKVIRKKPQDLI